MSLGCFDVAVGRFEHVKTLWAVLVHGTFWYRPIYMTALNFFTFVTIYPTVVLFLWCDSFESYVISFINLIIYFICLFLTLSLIVYDDVI